MLRVFSGERRLVGALDAIRDYPEPGEWWIGLLLLEPKVRNNHGLGGRIFQVCERWLAAQEADGIRLAVLEQNVRAARFWRRFGMAANICSVHWA